MYEGPSISLTSAAIGQRRGGGVIHVHYTGVKNTPCGAFDSSLWLPYFSSLPNLANHRVKPDPLLLCPVIVALYYFQHP